MDSEDDLKRQARRRLIGAVALVTAVVVILPMVLDREPKPTGQDIVLTIPDKDKVGEFTSQMVLPESAPVAASEPVAAGVSSAVASAPAVAPALQEKAQPSRPKKPDPKPEPVKHATAAHSPAPTGHDSKVAEKVQAAPKSGFVVQVGAFGNSGTAKGWRDKLSKQGLHAYTEKAGDKVRVRVGPYSTRAAAEKVLHKIAAQGTQPAVVDLN